MKYCKKCGVLYSGLLEVCPKCNAALENPPEEAPREATTQEKRRQWLFLVIGIPALIAFFYLIGLTMQKLGAF